MLPDNPHVPDRDLMLAADGELTPRRAAEVRAHLEACWPCRVREDELQSTIAEYVRFHHAVWIAECLRPRVRARC